MSLNLNPIDDLILALKLIAIAFLSLAITPIINIILRYLRRQEFEFSSVQLHIYQLVNKLTYNLTIARSQIFYFKIFHVGKTNLLEITDHFRQRIMCLAFEISEIDKYTLLLRHFFIETYQPIYHIIKHMYPLKFILVAMRRMCKIDSGNALVFPAFAKLIFVIEQAQFFYNVIHYQICVNLGLVGHVLFVRFAELADLVNVEPLIWVHFEHSYHQTSQLLAVSFWRWWKTAFGYSLKQLIQIQILLITLPERTPQRT